MITELTRQLGYAALGLKTKRQEAKAAADAAAAAAADACAMCDKVYGEDAEKDESWIACDRCNRWYHGTCVGMTQVESRCPSGLLVHPSSWRPKLKKLEFFVFFALLCMQDQYMKL